MHSARPLTMPVKESQGLNKQQASAGQHVSHCLSNAESLIAPLARQAVNRGPHLYLCETSRGDECDRPRG